MLENKKYTLAGSYVGNSVVVYVANRRSRPERKEKTYGKEDNKN